PTREEMEEIEVSSRLYQEDGALFMTAMILSRADTDDPRSTAVTFILSDARLVTLRHDEPRSFRLFAARAQRYQSDMRRGELVLTGLLEAIVDRTADILERVGSDLDAVSREVFAPPRRGRDFHESLRRIGRIGDLGSKVQESLISIARLLTFYNQTLDTGKGSKELRGRIKTLSRDVQSLTDHASFLSSKISFLLDATLGMINIEQNAIIKIFSVVAVIFLPPTLVASIYGMNFALMPELGWRFGYPWALGLMVVSAILPFWFFKRRGWL
ncbi:MAG: magnesium transporter CorA family protein, partial [Candidatus Competibacterales bacterium]|nr:magnesium transporter CorA family protein [Candidatus Competibacterales bacterium]